jgi:uracil-DNA glycosylase
MSLKRRAADLAASEAKKPKANGNIAAFFGAPKTASTTTTSKVVDADGTTKSITTVAAVPASSATKFDKEQWVSKLTAEQKDLLQLEIDTLDVTWMQHLKDELVSKSFLDLKRFLKQEHNSNKTIFPPAQDVYSWSVIPAVLQHSSQAITNMSR